MLIKPINILEISNMTLEEFKERTHSEISEKDIEKLKKYFKFVTKQIIGFDPEKIKNKMKQNGQQA